MNLTKSLFCKIMGSSYPFPCLKLHKSISFFFWSHCRILCTDSKCRKTLQDYIIYSEGEKVKEQILDVDIHINLLLSQPMGRSAFFFSHFTCNQMYLTIGWEQSCYDSISYLVTVFCCNINNQTLHYRACSLNRAG